VRGILLHHSLSFASPARNSSVLTVSQIVLYRTVLPYRSLHYTALHCIALYCIALCYPAVHCTVLCCFVVHCTICVSDGDVEEGINPRDLDLDRLSAHQSTCRTMTRRKKKRMTRRKKRMTRRKKRTRRKRKRMAHPPMSKADSLRLCRICS
jgi:hypothetical protein